MLSDKQLYIVYTLLILSSLIMFFLILHKIRDKFKLSKNNKIDNIKLVNNTDNNKSFKNNMHVTGTYLKRKQMNVAKINALMRKIDICLARNDFIDAEKMLLNILAIDNDHIDANVKLALVMMKTENYDKAIHMYHRCLELLPNDPVLYTNLGLCYFKKKNYNMSIACYNRAIEIDDTKASRFVNLAYVYSVIGDAKEAIKNYEQAVIREPNNVDYIFLLADSYSEQGMREEAKYYYKRILEIEPFNDEAKLKSKIGY